MDRGEHFMAARACAPAGKTVQSQRDITTPRTQYLMRLHCGNGSQCNILFIYLVGLAS